MFGPSDRLLVALALEDSPLDGWDYAFPPYKHLQKVNDQLTEMGYTDIEKFIIGAFPGWYPTAKVMVGWIVWLTDNWKIVLSVLVCLAVIWFIVIPYLMRKKFVRDIRKDLIIASRNDIAKEIQIAFMQINKNPSQAQDVWHLFEKNIEEKISKLLIAHNYPINTCKSVTDTIKKEIQVQLASIPANTNKKDMQEIINREAKILLKKYPSRR